MGTNMNTFFSKESGLFREADTGAGGGGGGGVSGGAKDDEKKEKLFIDMWAQDKSKETYLKEKFFGEKGLPKELRWIERKQHMDESKKIILLR